jgi:ABC-type transport system involved in cytochrome bd biosynthesis fused ATPase/permease subunit
LKRNDDSLWEIISVIAQQIDVFAGTIIENIVLDDSEAGVQKILALGTNDLLENLPDCYHEQLASKKQIFLSGKTTFGYFQGLQYATKLRRLT